MKKPPRWMSAYGRVRFWKNWLGLRVWVGLDLAADRSWFLVGKDVLIDPFTQQVGI